MTGLDMMGIAGLALFAFGGAGIVATLAALGIAPLSPRTRALDDVVAPAAILLALAAGLLLAGVEAARIFGGAS